MKGWQRVAGAVVLGSAASLALADDLTQAVKVEIRGEPGRYQLFRGGKPYVIRGAGFDTGDLEALKRYGGNSIRTWSVGDGSILDRAEALGITVSLCLNVTRERHGFDYDDPVAVAAQLDRMRAQVLKHRNHPALLTWIIGNELNFDYTNPRVYDAVNDISRMIHELDPNHPTTTATAGISAALMKDIESRAPDLDFVSIQVYGLLAALPRLIDEIGITMPIMVTEWGTIGHWEVPTTTWGAPLALDSARKSFNYRRGYEEVLAPLAGRVVGSYVFLWGQKQERTPTWYGMFAPDGAPTEAVDAMQYVWTGRWPADRAPKFGAMSLNGRFAGDSVRLEAGRSYGVSVEAYDFEGSPLRYEWRVRKESTAREVGGDAEKVPPVIDSLIDDPAARATSLLAPRQPGAYRLFVYVKDKTGATAHGNLPFFVDE